ncbi:MAG: tyrosine-type recombinase/integrase [Bryobacteraceae bacterium]
MTDVEMLRVARMDLEKANRSPNTRRAYKSDWKYFAAWCCEMGYNVFPATSETLASYATSMISSGLRISTTARRVAAVAFWHRVGGASVNPFNDDVKLVITGARRKLKERSRGKLALSVPELRSISKAPLKGGSPLDVRDRAMLILGFAAGLRRSEMVALDVGDVAFYDPGIVLQIRYSKTDQTAQGREVAVFAGKRPETCPVRALRDWLEIRGYSDGPLFVCFQSSSVLVPTNRRMQSRIVHLVVKRSVSLIGLPKAGYGAHSLRVGFVTSAAASGASALAIMQVTGHKNVQNVQRYCRAGERFTLHPLKDLL